MGSQNKFDKRKRTMLRTGLSGQMFDHASYRDHLETASENEFDSIQIRSTHLKPGAPEEVIEDILSFVKEKKIVINGLSCFVGNYGVLNDSECATAFANFAQFVELAVRMNAGMVRVWPGWQESASAPPEVWKRAALWMQISADFAVEKGIRLAMEMHHGTLCDSADSSARLLAEIVRDNVGVILDAANLYQVPSDYGPDAIAKLGEKIFDVHVKDIVQLTGSYFPYAFEYSYYAQHIGRFTKVVPPRAAKERYFCHRRINHGGVDWSAVITGLRKIGYKGYLTVESVCESNELMPAGKELAKACREDLQGLLKAVENKC